MTLTEFGKQVRKLRIDTGTLMKEMADFLNVSSAYLSSVEMGRKNVNDELLEETVKFFRSRGVKGKELEALRAAADSSKKEIRWNLENLDTGSRTLAAAFARRFDELTNEQKNRIAKVLDLEKLLEEKQSR